MPPYKDSEKSAKEIYERPMPTNDMEKCCVDGILMYDEKGEAIFPAKMICTKCSPAMEEKKCWCGYQEWMDGGHGPACPMFTPATTGEKIVELMGESLAKARQEMLDNATPAPSDWEEQIRKVVIGALKSCKHAHGEIEISSAEKRITHGLREPISVLLSSQREEIARKVLDEVRDTANLYSGAGESDCEKYNIIRALEERLAEFLKDNK